MSNEEQKKRTENPLYPANKPATNWVQALGFIALIIAGTAVIIYIVKSDVPKEDPAVGEAATTTITPEITMKEKIKELENRIKVIEDEPDIKEYELLKDTLSGEEIGNTYEWVEYTETIFYNQYCDDVMLYVYSGVDSEWEYISREESLDMMDKERCFNKEEVLNTNFFKPINN